jgi:Leucine-rich repeat (LRR) protein
MFPLILQSRETQGRLPRVCRYHIRDILLIITIGGLILGPLASAERSLQRERAAANLITQYGGKVTTRDVWPQWVPSHYRSAVVSVAIGQTRRPQADRDLFDAEMDYQADQSVPTLPETITALGALPRLSELSLSGAPITRADVARIPYLPGVVALDLSFTKVDDLSILLRFTKLRSLSLRHVAVDNDAVRPVELLKKLEKLDLANTELTDRAMLVIGNVTSLRWLDISGTRITDKGLAALAPLTRLQSLRIASTSIDGCGLAHLRGLQGLSYLDLGRRTRPENDPRGFRDSPWRAYEKSLYGDQTRNVAEHLSLESMPVFSVLKSLNLANTLLDDACVAAISRQPNLKHLDVSGTNIEDEWLRHLADSELESLNLSDTPLSSAGLLNVASIVTLTDLKIERTRISADDVGLLQRLPVLQTLALDQCYGGRALIECLMNLRSLSTLIVTNSGLADDEVALLRKLPNLKLLNLEGNKVIQESEKPAVDIQP